MGREGIIARMMVMRYVLAAAGCVLLLGAAALAGCGRAGGGGGAGAATRGAGAAGGVRGPARMVVHITVDSLRRRYILRLPAAYNGVKKLPLVMLLHGANDSAPYAEEAYGFVEKGEKEGFILVLPEALGNPRAWDEIGTAEEEGNGDLAFLEEVLAKVEKEYAVDGGRVYVAGHSSGAIMAYQLGAAVPEKIAALGIVAGTVGWHGEDGAMRMIPVPRVAVPVVVFHGKLDENILYEPPAGVAELGAKDYAYWTVGAAESAAWWAKADGCEMTPRVEVMAGGAVERRAYVDKGGREWVVLYTLRDGNHMWPGGRAMPGKTEKPVGVVSATDLMWGFFAGRATVPRRR